MRRRLNAGVGNTRSGAPSLARVLPRLLLCSLAAAAASAQQSFDEKLKVVGLEFAARVVQPGASAQRLQDLTDALNGGQAAAPMSATGGAARLRLSDVPAAAAAPAGGARVRWATLPAGAFYVDAARGADGAAGTEAAPFRTIARGVAAARSSGSGGGSRTVVLRAGTFFQGADAPAGVALTAADSGLTVMAYPGEMVWISGAAPLANLSWAPYRVNASSGENIWAASTAALSLSTRNFTGLRAGAERLVRARYPNNANPELGMGEMFLPAAAHWDEPAWCPRGVCARPPARFEPASPSRANESRSGTLYTLGIGGDGCSLFSPPAGFNCVDNQRWGGMVLRWPAGFNATADEMPGAKLPYSAAIADPRNPAQVNGWQGWFSRHFLLAGYDAARNHFTFGEGGYQGAEGMDDGFPMSLENVFEELDAPSEWFHDVVGQRLFVFWNATGAPNATLSATQARVLFNATGTQAAPVVNISFIGLGFRDTAHALFEPHGHPSSGDWALQRTAALFFEGTVGASVDGCVFERLDGLAVFLSGYARNASVTRSEFAWGGETAVALWGYGRGSPVPGVGPDMTGGDQPRGTYIGYNVFRELGVWQKQSAAVFQAEAGLSVIEHNFIYNGPRAGINFNDGALGGSLIQYNVLANLCRESGDHGPFNSWDRTAYLNDLRGYNSSTKLTDTFVSNFIIANYGSMAAIDNDDTSGHYEAHHNVFAYSEMGLKVDFAGHDNSHHDNLYAFPQLCGYLSEYHPHALDGHGASFYNNICAMTNDPFYYILGQTCNYTQPGGQWSFVPGLLLPGNDDGQGTRATTVEAAKQACGGGNSWCIGFTYNLSALAFPPLGQQTSLAPTGDLARGLRHCSYVCSADVAQQGDDDFHFKLVAPLNGATTPGAVSVQSVNFPDHYLSPIAGGGGRVGINAAPDSDDATWLLAPGLADATNWTLITQSKAAPAGAVLTVAATSTNPCGDGPDVVLAAPGGAAAPGMQTWLIGSAPVPPGEMLISFKRMGGVVPDAQHGSWVYPEKEGLTAVYNNTVFTHAGWVLECGLNLSDWQAQAPDHDPGSTVGPMPDDDVLIAAARRVLGL